MNQHDGWLAAYLSSKESNLMHRCKVPALLLFFLLLGFLTGCSQNANEDLEAFFRNAGKDMQVKIKPLPEMKSYFALEFNSDGALNDPFKLRKDFNKSAILAPNLNRPKQPLESYPLESIKYVGMLERADTVYALLKTPDDSIQQVQPGQYIGQNFGKVTAVTENAVEIREVIQDASTGDWVEQPASLLLNE